VGTALKTAAGTADDLFKPIGAALKTQFKALSGTLYVLTAISTALGSKLVSKHRGA